MPPPPPPPPPRSLGVDAYFPDEWGAPYIRAPKLGIHLNRFTRIFVKGPPGSPPKEITYPEAIQQGIDPGDTSVIDHLIAESYAEALPNPLDAASMPRPSLPEVSIPTQARGQTRRFSVYVPSIFPASLRAGAELPRPLEVVLWFGVGSELVRHGLRTFVERRSIPTAIIQVPGVEPGHPDAFGARWGIGITQDQVQGIIDRCFGVPHVPLAITTIYAFSTGYLGFIGTIRNSLISLSGIQRVVFVDCLYPEGGTMQMAVDKVRQATRGLAKIVTYAATTGTPGSFERRLQVNVPASGISWIAGRVDYQVLTHARVLSSGIGDQIIQWSEIDPARQSDLRALFASLPQRGSVISDPGVFQYVQGTGPPSGATVLADWYKGASRFAFREMLWKDHGQFPALIRLIWERQVPGWLGFADPDPSKRPLTPPTNLTEGQHDFLPLEFAWECLWP
jgi:hypothetical protein